MERETGKTMKKINESRKRMDNTLGNSRKICVKMCLLVLNFLCHFKLEEVLVDYKNKGYHQKTF